MHTNGGDLSLLHRGTSKGPDPGPARDPLRTDTVVAAGTNHNLFEFTHVIDDTNTRIEAAQIEDGIANQLAGTVVSDITTTINFMDLHAAGGK